MPSVGVKLYSVFFKLLLKHRLQSRSADTPPLTTSYGVTSRPSEESTVPARPVFSDDGVATKDIHLDPLTSLSVRIFLPAPSSAAVSRRHSFTTPPNPVNVDLNGSHSRRHSYVGGINGLSNESNGPHYRGYLPTMADGRKQAGAVKKLPIVLQFHGGAFVSGSADSSANDYFCRRIAKLLDAVVVAVGYRLAPESRYPAAFEDGFKVLNWLAKQANLASMVIGSGRIVDTFGASMVEPWLAAHGDPSRCVLLGVSCGANIADFVARKAVEAGKLLDPVKVVAQALCLLAWKLFLPEEEFSLDHPAANPLVPGRGPPLKCMPPTLTVVAEHDWMKDRAIAYSEDLRKVNVDAPVLEYKDAVHEFATLDILLKTPQAQACAEDIAIWVRKYISTRGHEFSY